MIKPRIKKGFNPQTGKAIIREEWPNICIYGLSDTEKEILNKSLPHPNVTIEDVTDEAVCMIEFFNFALVINPDMTLDDQYVLAESEFTYFKETAEGGRCGLDMTDAYRMNGATKVVREFELEKEYTCLKITDTIKCLFKSDIYWFMHTKADIEISENGKTAILTIGDKQLKATSHSDGTFSVMKAERLKGEWEWDEDYTDLQKLTVRLENVRKAEIKITLEPVR